MEDPYYLSMSETSQQSVDENGVSVAHEIYDKLSMYKWIHQSMVNSSIEYGQSALPSSGQTYVSRHSGTLPAETQEHSILDLSNMFYPNHQVQEAPNSSTDYVPHMSSMKTPVETSPDSPLQRALNSSMEYVLNLSKEFKYSYQSESAADRLSTSVKRNSPESLSLFETKKEPLIDPNVIVVPDDVPRPVINTSSNCLSSSQNVAYTEICKPGKGQEYISKIRSLVEGPQGNSSTSAPKRKPKAKTKKQSQDIGEKPQAKKRRKRSDPSQTPKQLRTSVYPLPVPACKDYVFIGPYGTFVPKSVYDTISWTTCQESTRQLMEFIFDDGSLATHSLTGDKRLDASIVQDVIEHVAERCFVAENYVELTISQLCEDSARSVMK